jgi:prolyl 4-hydroxylase
MIQEYSIISDNSFIGAWFLDDLSICDDLINFFESSEEKIPGIVFDQDKRQDSVIKDVKDSTDIRLRPNQEISKRYSKELHNVLELYKDKFYWSDKTGPWGIESINVQKYDPNGGYFVWHSERTSGAEPAVYRHLVFMTYLNTVEDQGETEFFYQQTKVKPQKGLTLIWPADWTHTHRGLTSPSETKYIATGWFSFYKV